jgi:hypothetical protein
MRLRNTIIVLLVTVSVITFVLIKQRGNSGIKKVTETEIIDAKIKKQRDDTAATRKQQAATEMKRRMAAESREYNRAHNLHSTPSPIYHFPFFKDEWTLTDAATEHLGLSEEQRTKAQAVLDHAVTVIQEELAKNLVVDEKKTNPAKNQYAYKIKANEETAEVISNNLKNELLKALGKTEAGMIFDEIDRSFDYACMASKNVDILVQDTILADGRPHRMIDFSVSDPQTGTVISYGKSNVERFKKNFGNILDFQQ